MATTYTTNYNLGKQENHADKFDMDVITDNADKIDAALTELQSGIDGKQATLTTEQLTAVNSGIDSDDVAQITTNKNNISSIYNQNGKTFNIIDWSNFGGNSDTGISYSYANDTITATGTKLTSDSYMSIAGVSSVIKTNTLYALVCVTTGSPRISARIFGFNGSTYTQLSDSASLAYFNSGNYQSYICRIVVGGSSGNSVDATIKPMLIEKSIYDAGFTDYQPYAMSNVELTEGLYPTAYTTPSLRQDYGLTLTWGGYAKIGNLCIVNMRLTCTSDIPHGEFFIQRLPSCADISSLSGGYSFVMLANNKKLNISCCVTTDSSAPTGLKGAIANTELTEAIPAGSFTLSGMYLCS